MFLIHPIFYLPQDDCMYIYERATRLYIKSFEQMDCLTVDSKRVGTSMYKPSTKTLNRRLLKIGTWV